MDLPFGGRRPIVSSYKLGPVRLNLLETSNGVELRVTSEIPAVVSRIKGLGFFGLMASQDHHREHHFMMAKGIDAHGY